MEERRRKDTETHYDIDALKANLERCDKNIHLFREAIDKELDNKIRLQKLIEELEK